MSSIRLTSMSSVESSSSKSVESSSSKSVEPGYTFRYDRDLQGRPWNYLNLCPSSKALQRERDKLVEMTGPEQCFKPIPVMIAESNNHLRGWSNYFGCGYPRKAFRQINRFVQERLERHLKRRSQRPFRPKEGLSWYAQLQRLGLKPL